MATSVEDSENTTKGAGQSDEENEEDKDNSNFECNICLDTAKDAVISMCGHLFCWACLHRWLETRAHDQTCPVCKAAISKEKVIPLYGRGSSDQKDPREKVPPRPAGQRTEPEPNNSFFPGFNMNDGGGMQFQFGIGAFPFALFTSFNHHNLFNGGVHRGLQMPPGPNQRPEDTFLNTVFMAIAVLFLLWLIVV